MLLANNKKQKQTLPPKKKHPRNVSNLNLAFKKSPCYREWNLCVSNY